MAHYSIDRRDIDFVLFEQFDLLKVLGRAAYKDFGRGEIDGVIDAAETVAREVLAPTFAIADREGCKLVDGQVYVPKVYEEAFKQLAEGGWIALNRSPEMGGMGLPIPVAAAITEMQIGAAASIGFYSGLTVAAGHLVETFAKAELKNLVVPKLYAGEWGGTMCLTEPHAGTAVGDLKTRAIPKGDDRYFIKGNKIFISAGDHQLTKNIVHLVLARVEGDPAGTKGISLFAVPKYRFDATGKLGARNDVTVTGIEHKMGINGSATCALSFGEQDDCEGILIGERCQGIVYMFQMMNEARLVCGLQGVAMGNFAYQLALAYARDRVQGAKVTDCAANPKPVKIVEHPDVRRNLMLAKAYGEGIRALLLQATFYAEHAQSAPEVAERQKNHDLLDLLTPVAKAYASDIGFKMTEIAIQVHGGYGYIKEYGVEQLMRDVKIASIYEGTNGVQALDLVGRKMRMKDGALVMTWLQEANTFVDAYREHAALAPDVVQLEKAKNALVETAMAFQAQSAQDPDVVLLGATPFLEMFGHVEVARLLIHQAAVAHTKLQGLKPGGAADDWIRETPEGSDARFYDNKLKTARFFVATVLPHVQAIAKAIKAGDRSALDAHFAGVQLETRARGTAMIDLYTFATPNGHKVSIALEELGLAYQAHVVHIGKNEQFSPAFVAINPNSKIPAIIDRDTGITVFESGAILLYLADKTGQLVPHETAKRFEVIEWLMFQMASVGPMFGQLNHFKKFAPEPVPYAIERYTKETKRLQAVLDKQLEGREYVCGAYSIADIALYPWIAIYEFQGLTLDGLPDLDRWVKTMQERPAVQRGMKVP